MMLCSTSNCCMNKVVLKKCSCSYSKKKNQDVSGITFSSVADNAVDPSTPDNFYFSELKRMTWLDGEISQKDGRFYHGLKNSRKNCKNELFCNRQVLKMSQKILCFK